MVERDGRSVGYFGQPDGVRRTIYDAMPAEEVRKLLEEDAAVDRFEGRCRDQANQIASRMEGATATGHQTVTVPLEQLQAFTATQARLQLEAEQRARRVEPGGDATTQAFGTGAVRSTDRSSLLVVGLSGPARSGKDTTAKYLEAAHGFTRLALGDVLRAVAGNMDGPTWELSKDLAAAGVDRRSLLQRFGTECRLEAVEAVGGPPKMAELLWAAVVAAEIRYLMKYHPAPRRAFVVPDVRYPYEVDALRTAVWSWGGRFEVWKLERPGEGTHVGGVAGHSSEKHYDQIAGRALANDSSQIDLFRKVDVLATGLLAGDATDEVSRPA